MYSWLSNIANKVLLKEISPKFPRKTFPLCTFRTRFISSQCGWKWIVNKPQDGKTLI